MEIEKENNEEKENSKLLVIMIIVLTFVLFTAIGIGMYFFLSEDEQIQEKVYHKRISNKTEQEVTLLSDINILYPMDTFVVNLNDNGLHRFLKVNISFEIIGDELNLILDNKIPVIRDIIIRVLSSKSLSDVSSKKGKMKLENQILNSLNEKIEDGYLKSIYFTEFIIQ